MAIAKWIPFGAQQPVTTENTKPEPVPTVSPAGAKKFGLENVCLHASLGVLSSLDSECYSLATPGESNRSGPSIQRPLNGLRR